nr:hypothetical protein [uncultured Psychroserpens sp.]
MHAKYFSIIIVAIFSLSYINQSHAQPQIGKSIDISIGYGLSIPYDEDIDITGSGFYAQGEYVVGISKWFGLRGYAGLILTSADENDKSQNDPEYKVTSNAFLIGGKFRIAIPIPWVAPYIETGIGASIGSFETFIPTAGFEKKGILLHIPVSLGLALGPEHNWDIAFTYYFHPSVEQFAGAAALGFSFPLD